MSWSLVLHGGAGSIERHRLTPEQDAGARAGLSRALDAGAAILSGGGSALDAVEAAVQVLEDDPHFNAGRGAAFTRDGGIELDAAIMDGATRAAGAVAGITQTRSPVALARRVMAASPHVLLSGAGAEQFARDQGLEVAPDGWFETPERRRQLDEMLSRNADAFDVDMKYGTVGAVARDSAGHVAAATSTGGVTGKRWGRIGDSPLIGSGTFADDRACAVSCTGSGEFFIRVGVGHEIAARIRLVGDTPQAAADAVMAEVHALGGTGGVIVATPVGDAVWSLTTPGMYRARATAAGLREVAIYGDE
ncbi:isoaspartyl peptidase/L-asparaginase family protein [Sphingomonas sp. S6]|jgi:beta-aspartyl-peptidase (threonine type)|uniref:isoaspartyl peptidase/L-asparaginase family protein n=1 Tax=Sphingomonas sp. S6 TaxID=3368600 RepID=UPI000FB2E481|nr:isoaspartyl peptidase/L-asparaginase [uncultured Sphingomonas sp.]RTL15541.1 MAG: isoaspartyl peptidase/L-asparaginase [Sphingomonadaceae bacterium]